MDNSTTHPWLGTPVSSWSVDSKSLYAITLFGKFAAAKVGVHGRSTIAIQCISGRNFDKYLYFNATAELEDRYTGMKYAFGPDKEILIPERRGSGTSIHGRRLRSADYENLILASIEKSTASSNLYLSAKRRHFPIWRWLFNQGGVLGYLVFAVCTACAFFPIVILALASWATGSSWKAEVAHAVLFCMLAVYDGIVLDVRRDVAYIRVKRTDVGPDMDGNWVTLMNRAVEGPAPSASIAVEELATGQVRKDRGDLVIPVMTLRPWVEFNAASWFFILTNFRAPLLALSSALLQASHFNWMIAHGCIVFLQALLQDKLARMFLYAAEPREVYWFRRLPNRKYDEEVEGYTWTLE